MPCPRSEWASLSINKYPYIEELSGKDGTSQYFRAVSYLNDYFQAEMKAGIASGELVRVMVVDPPVYSSAEVGDIFD